MKRIYWSSLSLYDLFLTRKVKRTEMKFENYLNQMEEEIVHLKSVTLITFTNLSVFSKEAQALQRKPKPPSSL